MLTDALFYRSLRGLPPRSIVEIAHHLNELQVRSFQGKPFIDIAYTSTTNATNTVNSDDEKISSRRCYLAPLYFSVSTSLEVTLKNWMD